MQEKNPKQLEVFYDKVHVDRCAYSFVFSSNINDWIHSRQRKYDEKGRRKKANKNK
jgi:hypothetical protein